MPKLIDLTGQRFGRLVALEHVPYNHPDFPKGGWLCQCDCGNKHYFDSHSLTSGSVKSCGCYVAERLKNTKIASKHGMSNSRVYITWRNMHVRCENPNDKRYADYGGRGIQVCDEWKDFQKFYEWAMANGYADNLTIDRKDVNGDYEPGNCRFITRAENNKNRRCVKRGKKQ